MVEYGRARTSDGVEIHFESIGGGPPLLFVHGLGDTGARFRPIVASLRSHFQCVRIDLRGHGQSAPAPDYAALRLDRDLAAVTSLLGIERPLLVGHSLGGVAVSTFAARHGAAKVVNIDQPLEWSDLAARVRPFAAAITQGRGGEVLLQLLQEIGLSQLGPELRSQLVASVRRLPSELIHEVWRPLLEQDDETNAALVTGSVSGIDAPYLSLHGSAPAPSYTNWLARHIPSAQIEVWQGAGHYLHLTEPERFTARLHAFFDSPNP